MGKQKYRVTNWSEYNAALKQRGSLTVWIEEGFEKVWHDFSALLRKSSERVMLRLIEIEENWVFGWANKNIKLQIGQSIMQL